jgi:hypothetical protein
VHSSVYQGHAIGDAGDTPVSFPFTDSVCCPKTVAEILPDHFFLFYHSLYSQNHPFAQLFAGRFRLRRPFTITKYPRLVRLSGKSPPSSQLSPYFAVKGIIIQLYILFIDNISCKYKINDKSVVLYHFQWQ